MICYYKARTESSLKRIELPSNYLRPPSLHECGLYFFPGSSGWNSYANRLAFMISFWRSRDLDWLRALFDHLVFRCSDMPYLDRPSSPLHRLQCRESGHLLTTWIPIFPPVISATLTTFSAAAASASVRSARSVQNSCRWD